MRVFPAFPEPGDEAPAYLAKLALLAAIGIAVPAHAGAVPPFDGATGWLNSQPLVDANLRGKVIVVNFWTYSCINSLRQVPYVRAWAEKYKKQGLVVIGVHSPEFAFERDAGNVRRALAEYNRRAGLLLYLRLRDGRASNRLHS